MAYNKPEVKGVVMADRKVRVSPSSKVLVFLLILASLLVIATLGVNLVPQARVNSIVDNDRTQAVFLSNGQVLVGDLSSVDERYVKVEHVYSVPSVEALADTNFQPVKLNAQAYGPDDEIYVVRDQILYWQNLREDSKVIQKIQ
jgi:hypothetical protein